MPKVTNVKRKNSNIRIPNCDKASDQHIKQREDIKNIAQKYVNKNNCIDIKLFRKENLRLYNLINYYFGGVNGMLDEFGWFKLNTSTDQLSLTDQLALRCLLDLRKKGLTFDEIALEFNVSKMRINTLYRTLKAKEKSTKSKPENISNKA